jgi:hypothetical protein
MSGRKPPTAREIERAIDQAENATIAARSDVARWVSAGPAEGCADRQRVDHLLHEAQVKYSEALRIVRGAYVRGAPRQYPVPPAPLHPGAA